jgi:hypothetical protein
LTEARQALALAGGALDRDAIGDRTFWLDPNEGPRVREPGDPTVHLLPNYDELLVAFRDRSDAMDPALPTPARSAAEILAHVIVRNGLVVGGWKRRDAGASTAITMDQLVRLTPEERAALRANVSRLEAYLGHPVEVSGLD